jgi:hypothetical protein
LTELESLVVKFSVHLSECSFHAHELDSTEKFVPIPLLKEDKEKYSCGVRPACPNSENFTPLGLPVAKFSVGLSEHSFHTHKLDSTKTFVPIPLLNENNTKSSCVESDLHARTQNFTQLELPVVKFSVGLSEHSFYAHKLDSTQKFVPFHF